MAIASVGENHRRHLDATSPENTLLYKNCAVATAEGLVNMSINGFSRRESPDLSLMSRILETDFYQNWAAGSTE